LTKKRILNLGYKNWVDKKTYPISGPNYYNLKFLNLKFFAGFLGSTLPLLFPHQHFEVTLPGRCQKVAASTPHLDATMDGSPWEKGTKPRGWDW